jgi:hypothetical protein
MSEFTSSKKRAARPPSCTGNFAAKVNQEPFEVTSLVASQVLRPTLSESPGRWVWKVIAEGKVGKKQTSIGLFFDRDLPAGTYNIIGSDKVNVIYNQTPHWRSVVYHSEHFQTGHFTLLEADVPGQALKGHFSFGICAIEFAVTEGAFDLHYPADQASLLQSALQ